MDEEKERPAHVYIHKETSLNDPHNERVLLQIDQRASAERRLLKKLDYRLLPTIIMIYIMNNVDVR